MKTTLECKTKRPIYYLYKFIYFFMSSPETEQCKTKKCCKMVCYASKLAVVLAIGALFVITWKLCGRITKIENQINPVVVSAEQTK